MSCEKAFLSKKAMESFVFLLYKVFRLVILLGISYVMLYPVVKQISLSLSSPNDLYNGSRVWIPMTPTFTNYYNALKYFDYLKHFFITLKISVICTIIQVVIDSLVGYGLARYRFKGNGLVFILLILSIIIPTQSYMLPQYLEYYYFDFFGIGNLIGAITGAPVTVNLLNTHWVYFLPAIFGVGLSSGVFIFIFRQFFMNMPKDLEEAAKVDGCNAFTTYVKIMVPNAVPIFVTVALLCLIFYWNDESIANMFLFNQRKYNLTMYLKDVGMLQGQVSENRKLVELAACMLMVEIPLMLVFAFGQRFFVESMDRSGIKG